MTQNIEETHFQLLKKFFERSVCQEGTRPLKDGIEIRLFVEERGPITLTKQKGKALVLNAPPEGAADITLHIPEQALITLSQSTTENVGEIGVEILRLMAHRNPEMKIRPRVHIGLLTFLRHGYLGVIPIGGGEVMKYLASKGFANISKIKEAIANLRE